MLITVWVSNNKIPPIPGTPKETWCHKQQHTALYLDYITYIISKRNNMQMNTHDY